MMTEAAAPVANEALAKASSEILVSQMEGLKALIYINIEPSPFAVQLLLLPLLSLYSLSLF